MEQNISKEFLNSDDSQDVTPHKPEGEGIAVVDRKPEAKTKEPPMYAVKLLNDDFTPMDFVTLILESVFSLSHEKATQVMLDIHNKGVATAGIFPYEIAETKVAMVTEKSRTNEYPLRCIMEKN